MSKSRMEIDLGSARSISGKGLLLERERKVETLAGPWPQPVKEVVAWSGKVATAEGGTGFGR
ncbi:MAG: hypothetical protein ACREN8_12855 [Candidatus Dormibacteraceae bacterium]